jgi:hypothetical protein
VTDQSLFMIVLVVQGVGRELGFLQTQGVSKACSKEGKPDLPKG